MLLEKPQKSDWSLADYCLYLQYICKDQPWLLWESEETRFSVLSASVSWYGQTKLYTFFMSLYGTPIKARVGVCGSYVDARCSNKNMLTATRRFSVRLMEASSKAWGVVTTSWVQRFTSWARTKCWILLSVGLFSASALSMCAKLRHYVL